MFKWIFGIVIIVLFVIAFFPAVAAWGIAVKDYFLKTIKKDN